MRRTILFFLSIAATQITLTWYLNSNTLSPDEKSVLPAMKGIKKAFMS